MYTFLKSSDHSTHEQNPTWWMVSAGRVQTLNVCDTYDNNGFKIHQTDAGDYLEILTPLAASIANQYWNEEGESVDRFKVGDTISAYEQEIEFDNVVTQCQEGLDYNIYRVQCRGFNYHDGHNWKTILVDSIDNSNEYQIEDDADVVFELKQAFDSKSLQDVRPGIKTYKSGRFEIEMSDYPASFEYAKISMI